MELKCKEVNKNGFYICVSLSVVFRLKVKLSSLTSHCFVFCKSKCNIKYVIFNSSFTESLSDSEWSQNEEDKVPCREVHQSSVRVGCMSLGLYPLFVAEVRGFWCHPSSHYRRTPQTCVYHKHLVTSNSVCGFVLQNGHQTDVLMNFNCPHILSRFYQGMVVLECHYRFEKGTSTILLIDSGQF